MQKRFTGTYTLPLDSNSVFTVRAEINPVGSNTEVVAKFKSTRARDYALEETSNLSPPAAWTNVSGYVQGNDGEQNVAHTNASPAGFYRVRARLPGTP